MGEELKVVDLHAPDPVAACVDALERLVVEAKAGEIRAFGFFAVCADGTTFTDLTRGASVNSKMVAASARLHHRVMSLDDSGDL